MRSGIDSESYSIISYGGSGTAFVEALNDTLDAYGGSTQGNAPDGTVDVEFPNMGCAYEWLRDFGMLDASVLRDPLRAPLDTVVIIFLLPLFMYRLTLRNATEA